LTVERKRKPFFFTDFVLRWVFRWVLPCILLSAIGLSFVSIGFVPYQSVRQSLDSLSGDGSADPYTLTLHRRIQFIAFLISGLFLSIGLAVLALSKTKFGLNVLGRTCRFIRKFRQDQRQLFRSVLSELFTSRWLLIFSFLLALSIRLPFVLTPIRFDEAISWRDYAAKPVWLTITLYGDPNNHVFHNVLSGCLMKCFGESLYSLRAVSILCGALIVTVSAWLAKTIAASWNFDVANDPVTRNAGVVTAIALCSNPMLNEFSIYSRGYSLLTLLWLLSAILLVHSIKQGNAASWIVSVVFASLGLWTIPVMVYPIIAMIVYRILIGWKFSNSIFWLLSVSGLAILFYGPILIVSGPQAIVGNSYVRSLSFREWSEQLPATFDVYRKSFLWNLPSAIQGIAIGIIMSASYYSANYRRVAYYAMIAMATVALTITFQRVVPPERTWTWCIAPMSIALGIAIPTVIARTTSDGCMVDLASVLVVICLLAIPSIRWLSGKELKESVLLGICREASDAAAAMKELRHPQEPIVAVCPASGTLDWYAKQFGIASSAFDPPKIDSSLPVSGNSVIVAVVTNGQFQQNVTSVLAALESTRPWIDGTEELLWQRDALALYRVLRK